MAEISIYKDRMTEYIPPVLQRIKEFQGIIEGEYPEFEQLDKDREWVLDQAYLTTMGEDRVAEWETILGIIPIEGSSVGDRRDTIIARIRGQGKLNTSLINSIVNTFTGGTANSWVENGILYIEITPPPNNKQYRFANVEQEINKKIPAHLGVQISRNYYEWGEVKSSHATWQDVLGSFDTWNDVFINIVPR